MDSALWAEWILARLTDRGCAASMVGDLLETAAQHGPSWFSLSVAKIVLSLTWRRTIAYAAAYCVASFLAREVITLVFGIHPMHTPPDNSDLLRIASWFGLVSWIAASYAAIRYGLSDKFARLALGFCGLITVAIFYWWMPIVTVACVALAFSIVVASVRSAEWSRASVALAFALVFGFGGSHLTLYLDPTVQGHFYYPMTHYVEVAFRFLTVWTTTASCAWMHHLLLERNRRRIEIESPTQA